MVSSSGVDEIKTAQASIKLHSPLTTAFDLIGRDRQRRFCMCDECKGVVDILNEIEEGKYNALQKTTRIMN